MVAGGAGSLEGQMCLLLRGSGFPSSAAEGRQSLSLRRLLLEIVRPDTCSREGGNVGLTTRRKLFSKSLEGETMAVILRCASGGLT